MKYIAIGENHLYQKAYTRGMKCGTRTVAVYVLRDYAAQRLQKENPEKKKINRVGLTVTKKLGHAVVRSRVKRILREAYRQMDTATPVKRGFLIVLAARDAAVPAKTQDVLRDLQYAFRKLGMLEGMPFPPKSEGQNGQAKQDHPQKQDGQQKQTALKRNTAPMRNDAPKQDVPQKQDSAQASDIPQTRDDPEKES